MPELYQLRVSIEGSLTPLLFVYQLTFGIGGTERI